MCHFREAMLFMGIYNFDTLKMFSVLLSHTSTLQSYQIQRVFTDFKDIKDSLPCAVL